MYHWTQRVSENPASMPLTWSWYQIDLFTNCPTVEVTTPLQQTCLLCRIEWVLIYNSYLVQVYLFWHLIDTMTMISVFQSKINIKPLILLHVQPLLVPKIDYLHISVIFFNDSWVQPYMVEFLRSISLILMSYEMPRIFGCFLLDKKLVQIGSMGVMWL